MGWKGALVKPFAKLIARQVRFWANRPIEAQERVFNHLVERGVRTKFGREHGFEKIRSYEDFKNRVPIRDYEALRPYIDRIFAGEISVLWPGIPDYFSKTSGTTSGTKYIPITKDSMPNHMNSARNAMMCYVAETGSAKVFDGKMMFISGSPELEERSGIKTGRLSGIVNHHVQPYIKANQMPSYETNCIEDFEQKLEAIIDETLQEDMRMISGIPPWVQMYFERIVERTGKKVGEVFPNFEVYVYGGVNYEPYRQQTREAIGRDVAIIETYPASEGFIAYQDSQEAEGLLLNVKSGIFFEFIPMEEIEKENPERIALKDVELDKNYAVVINNNAGLWGYNLGDMVKFVSDNPYRLVVAGRTKHFISAFGEHVIGEEVESAIKDAARQFDAQIVEFHVAPEVNPPEGELPYHEWFVEFGKAPADMEAFRLQLDSNLRDRNAYYDDLVSGKILQPLKLHLVAQDTFRNVLRGRGKLGGQNKVPRLANDRQFAGDLVEYVEQ
jgi:hypothetical protein